MQKKNYFILFIYFFLFLIQIYLNTIYKKNYFNIIFSYTGKGLGLLSNRERGRITTSDTIISLTIIQKKILYFVFEIDVSN